MAKSAHVRDVGDNDFEQAVLKESHKRPVVVDFWAPWCGPCRTLGPVLEKLADEKGGAFLLAKVNTDKNGRYAQALGVQGIPAVKAFKDGQLVDEFVGAMPEGRVRAWLDGFLPGEAEALVAKADAALAAGRLADAEADYERALDEKPRLWTALVGMARIHAARGEAEQAERQLALILADDENKASAAVAQIRLALRVKSAGSIEAARAKVEAAPDDLEARLALAAALSAQGELKEAMETLLEVVRRDKGELRQRARAQMVELFDVAGPRSELSEDFRGKLARILFS